MSQSWAAWAEDYLGSHWHQSVESAIESLSSARWHPNGFVVLRLGEISAESHGTTFNGSHRVHIWPGEIRRRDMPGHPVIHSHDWELQSLILRGPYTDVIYEASADARPLLTHAVYYGGEAGDSITPTGKDIRLARRRYRTVDSGAFHHMDVGVPHETLVPTTATVVTYVMMGPSQRKGMMLAGETPFAATAFQRPFLSVSEKSYAQRTLERLSTSKAAISGQRF